MDNQQNSTIDLNDIEPADLFDELSKRFEEVVMTTEDVIEAMADGGRPFAASRAARESFRAGKLDWRFMVVFLKGQGDAVAKKHGTPRGWGYMLPALIDDLVDGALSNPKHVDPLSHCVDAGVEAFAAAHPEFTPYTIAAKAAWRGVEYDRVGAPARWYEELLAESARDYVRAAGPDSPRALKQFLTFLNNLEMLRRMEAQEAAANAQDLPQAAE